MEAQEAIIRQFPAPPDRGVISARAVLEQRLIHIADATEDPEIWPLLIANGARSYAAIPLMRDGKAIGAISMNSPVPGGFSESQIVLLKTFAEQAVIAIGSAETLRVLQTRSSDLRESLEYRTATSDVLKVISRSTFDLQPVLGTLVETAARLCDADQAIINRREGVGLRLAANFGFPPEYEAHFRSHGLVSFDAHTVSARAASERRPVHIHDVTTVPGYPEAPIRLGKQRTSLGVPLLREEEVIGTIVLARRRVEPFTDRQIELISTFADQAVIAIENTRLLTEQQETLDQQTATAEVLQVINASPGNLAPVFDAMLDRAMRLCDGAQGTLWMFDRERMSAAATAGYSSELAEQLSEWREIHPFQRRLSQGERVFQIVDLAAEELYRSGNPLTRAAVDVAGIRTVVFVALVKDATSLGGFTIGRREVRAFTDKHIALLQNFSEQAVIAIENARLNTEQREALEQQTATAEVLQVINASPGDLVPVFDAMLEKAIRLCGANYGHFRTYDGEGFPLAAVCGDQSLIELHRQRMRYFVPGPHNPISRFRQGERLIHISDAAASEADRDDPGWRELVDTGTCRSVLAVALRKDTDLLGYISVYRLEVRPFSNKQIALLENFAAQAVIAMENARLITEQREALEQQTATAEVLQVINASPGNLTPVFGIILEKVMRLCEATFGSLYTYDGHRFHSVAQRGVPAAYAAYREMHPPELLGQGGLQLAVSTGRAVQTADIDGRQAVLGWQL